MIEYLKSKKKLEKENRSLRITIELIDWNRELFNKCYKV